MNYKKEVELYKKELEYNEKSEATIKKYVRDINEFIE